jgi:hypothetical protein
MLASESYLRGSPMSETNPNLLDPLFAYHKSNIQRVVTEASHGDACHSALPSNVKGVFRKGLIKTWMDMLLSQSELCAGSFSHPLRIWYCFYVLAEAYCREYSHLFEPIKMS